jgi:phosphatidylserine synthase
MAVIMAVVMAVAIGNELRHRMTAWIAFVAMAMIMIMTMSRFRVDRLREPALFTNLRRFGGFIIVLSPTSFSMSNKAFERGFVHVTGQWNS